MPKLDPQTVSWRASPIRVFVPREVEYDLKKMNTVTASVLGRLGCPGCHSGFLLDFQSISEFTVDPETLQVREIGG